MRTLLFLLFLLLFGIAGYLRERFFEHMNIIMAGVYRGTNEYEIIHQEVPAVMEGFMQWSYASLYYSKYIFTLLWTVLFYLLSYIALKKLNESRFLTRILNISYTGMLLLAGISIGLGYLINGTLKNDEYTLSRWLLGIAQSPIICLILLAAGKLNNPSFNQEK